MINSRTLKLITNRTSVLVLILALSILSGFIFLPRTAKPKIQSVHFPEISADIKAKLLVRPTGQETAEEKMQYNELVQSFAQASTVLDISGCSPQPLALKTRLNDKIVLQNLDDKSHHFQVKPEYAFDVPAHGTITIPAEFGRGYGIYGYSCDNSGDIKGKIFIAPPEQK